MMKKSLSDRRGTTTSATTGSSSIAFDFGDGTGGGAGGAGPYSKTSGILSSVGRLGLLVLGGALVLVALLLRQDSATLDTTSGSSSATASTVRGAVDASTRSSSVNNSAADGAKTGSTTTTTTADYITLQTPHGSIRIILRPDLSPESVDYVRSLIESKTCDDQSCRLYRAEKPGILQGILKSGADADPLVAVQPNKVFGQCPEKYRDVKQDCPSHDPNCGCHGPIMVKGGECGWLSLNMYSPVLACFGRRRVDNAFMPWVLSSIPNFHFFLLYIRADRCRLGRWVGRRAGLFHQHLRTPSQALGQHPHCIWTCRRRG